MARWQREICCPRRRDYGCRFLKLEPSVKLTLRTLDPALVQRATSSTRFRINSQKVDLGFATLNPDDARFHKSRIQGVQEERQQ